VLDARLSSRIDSAFPTGTLAVNLVGAFVLGLLAGSGVSGDLLKILALGLLGGFTTFSTWVFESHRLAEDGLIRMAAVNVALSLLAGLAAVWLGERLGGLL
jgi:CrcB protein